MPQSVVNRYDDFNYRIVTSSKYSFVWCNCMPCFGNCFIRGSKIGGFCIETQNGVRRPEVKFGVPVDPSCTQMTPNKQSVA